MKVEVVGAGDITDLPGVCMGGGKHGSQNEDHEDEMELVRLLSSGEPRGTWNV